MSRFGTHYNVSHSTGVCAHTGEAMPPGTPCIAALCERVGDDGAVEEGFERFDYSIGAWESGARPKGLFSYWKTLVPQSNAPRQMLVDDEVLLELFQRLADDERPQRIAFRFVLGLILMRKKQLKLVGREPAGNDQPERWLMQRRRAGADEAPMPVVNPNLSEDDIREITEQLSEVLNSEL